MPPDPPVRARASPKLFAVCTQVEWCLEISLKRDKEACNQLAVLVDLMMHTLAAVPGWVASLSIRIITDVCNNSIKPDWAAGTQQATENVAMIRPGKSWKQLAAKQLIWSYLVLCSRQVQLQSSSHYRYLPKLNLMCVITSPNGISRLSPQGINKNLKIQLRRLHSHIIYASCCNYWQQQENWALVTLCCWDTRMFLSPWTALRLGMSTYCKFTNFCMVPIFVLSTWNWVVRTNFRTFEGLRRKWRWNSMASKQKKKFHTILNFVLFQKYEMYENKYRTKICNFTVRPALKSAVKIALSLNLTVSLSRILKSRKWVE